MVMIKAGVAMSGGVDSTMAALLLAEAGYDVHGFFMLLPLPRLDEQLRQVRTVAAQLAVPLHCIDLRRQFREEIIGYFTDSYLAGLTPNPCIKCNHRIKFGLLARSMREKGMDRIATGHYARVQETEEGSLLLRGKDLLKDQSYFLSRLTVDQRKDLLLPLGEWSKDAICASAASRGFRFSGGESQDVCFLPSGLRPFLQDQGVADTPGDILSTAGARLGTHSGAWNFTIGQRRGLNLADASPWYVIHVDGPNNRLVVGKDRDLYQATLTLHSLRWSLTTPALPWSGQVQLRSRHRPAAATVEQTDIDRWQVSFAEPQRAVTPGQFAVLYDNNRLIGSGIIDHGPPFMGTGQP